MDATLSDIKSIERVKTHLRFGPICVNFCAQGTRHVLLLCKSGDIATGGVVESWLRPNTVVVAVLNYPAGAYAFDADGSIHPIYLAEKLRIDNEPDSRNVCAFINALFHPSGTEWYLSRVRSDMDGGMVDPDAELLVI
jgi:hypothetical protein